VGDMRGMHVLAGIASVGLVAAVLGMGAPASARDRVNGTGGDDNSRGTAVSDTIRGVGGRDYVYALAGADRIGGGAGADGIFAGRGDDIIRGGLTADGLIGGQGGDTLYGGAGGDGLSGGAGSDVIFGGRMADSLILDGRGADTIYGGLGNDNVILEKDGAPDTVTCGPGEDEVWGATSENTVASDCEEVHVKQPHCACEPHRIAIPPAAAERARDRVTDTSRAH
jgi:Ca2+-binding RTX toxin-like protein